MKNKEFRKKIRGCRTEKELQDLIINHNVWVRRRGLYEKISCHKSVGPVKKPGELLYYFLPLGLARSKT